MGCCRRFHGVCRSRPFRVLIMTNSNTNKGADGDLNQHLCNHVHLSNCIHLKHHVHNHNPVLHDRSLRRDLIVLQRTRSLRDPSASPPSRPSPLLPDLLFKGSECYASLGRKHSTVHEHPGGGRMLSRRSSPPEPAATSKAQDSGRILKKESSTISCLSGRNGLPLHEEDWNELRPVVASGSSKQIDVKINVKGRPRKCADVATVRQQLNGILASNEDVASSNVNHHGRISHYTTLDEPKPSVHGSCSGFNRVKRRKFHRLRGMQSSTGPMGSKALNDFYCATNSSVKGLVHPVYNVEKGKDLYCDQDAARGSRNMCGIHLNWSRIHHRGKSFLDMAGRSLSCGLSDPRLQRSSPVTEGRGASYFPDTADDSSSHSKSEAQALPLLVDGSGSQGTSGNAASAHDYSGELGIFAGSLLKRDGKSDLASEMHSGDSVKSRGDHHGGHHNLTQKYMPKTFRDLVGQNLVSQVLSNAVSQRKIGLLYVFYGPHGTGKTSCARIFARALNCSSLEHPKPCGFCGSCIAHDVGKSRNIKEVGTVNNFDFESFVDLLDSMMIPQEPSRYRVLIVDDCDNLSANSWNALSKVIDRASRRLVFVLICSSLDLLPHIITSRCQKFFFPKLKDGDITYALQRIATKECLEIDQDALKLIASRSDGSLRDAEMTLEQLSLLGQRISVALVQELAGLVSDDKLVHLLDLALSADTVNTVKNLREIMETGVEPLALMSQLATVVTDILAGIYDFNKDKHRRKFFRRQSLSKENVEKLRLALKTLSEAEKQLRLSGDKLTWLTAALLQLDPKQQYGLPTSSAYSSSVDSPLVLYKNAGWPAKTESIGPADLCGDRIEKHAECSNDAHDGRKVTGSNGHRGNHVGLAIGFEAKCAIDADTDPFERRRTSGKVQTEIEEIWLEVLENIQIGSIKEFMYKEGRLITVSVSAAPTVKLIFSSSVTKSKAEKFKTYILQAFESVLGSPVIIELVCDSEKNVRPAATALLTVPTSKTGPLQLITETDSKGNACVSRRGYDGVNGMIPSPGANVRHVRTSEIEEVAASLSEMRSGIHTESNEQSDRRVLEGAWAGEGVVSSCKKSETGSLSAAASRPKEHNHCQALVRSKVSLAHVIQQSEGSTEQNTWTKRKAVSIAEKLEQENLRLEPRSRSLLCWRSTGATRRKFSRVKFHTRKRRSLLKLVTCGICRSTKSSK